MPVFTFPVGRLLVTPTIMELFAYEKIVDLLIRYGSRDWGDLCDEEKSLNDQAIENGNRILARYQIDDEKIYIITESDRSCTTVLMSYEY
ncbi:hypothetical protein FW755_09485 [Lonepinella koalarum]|uniref:hypothetical protein n=1 Tax=Lonepinella koalarum TaxID=53417 RepID=UPI0011E4012F|nr:hypothetical protein [Lonepinella koalarum]TYG35307.1 hypothetical protein FW755_09485 [Lonepinella koalarum]